MKRQYEIEYKDTGCRYYPSCLECGEPDDCIYSKIDNGLHKPVDSPEDAERKARQRAYYQKNRQRIIERNIKYYNRKIGKEVALQ